MPTFRILAKECHASVWEAWFNEDEQVRFLGSSPEDAARRLVEGSPERQPDVSTLASVERKSGPEREEFVVTGA